METLRRWHLRANPYEWAVILGMVGLVITYTIELTYMGIFNISSLDQVTWNTMIIWAFIEEGLKLLAIVLTLYFLNGNKEKIFNYGILVGLGFGLTEALSYLIGTPSDFVFIIVNRIFDGIPIHIATTGFVALIWYWLRNKSVSIKLPLIIMALFVSIVIHAMANYFVNGNDISGWFGVCNILLVLTLIIVYFIISFIKRVRKTR